MSKNNELQVEAEFLSHLKDNKNQVEEELKQIKKQIEKQEQKLDHEEQSFKGFNNITYSLKTTVIPNVLAENRPLLIQALKENGFEYLVKEEVNAKTFKSFVNEQGWEEDEQLPEYLQGIVKLYEKTTIGTRRS